MMMMVNKEHMQPLYHRRRKDFLIGGGTIETTHRVVSNLYENLGGHMPPVPPGSYAYVYIPSA